MSERSEPFDEAQSDEDARLIARLGEALGPDLPPPGLVARAEGLVAFAEVDRELAELLDPARAEPAGVRGPAGVDTALVFEVADGSIAVELTVERDRLRGQVLAGSPAEVVLEPLAGPARTCPVDALGRFAFDQPAAGPTRLRLRDGSTRPVTTDWFLL